MARSRTATARSGATTIKIAAPAPIQRRRPRQVVRRAARGARRAVGGVGRAALGSRHTMYAVGSAAILGYAIKEGWKIPTFFNLTPAASAGIAAWAFGYFGKNKTAEHVATGLLSAAVYDKAKGTTPAGSVIGHGVGVVFDEDVDGDEYDIEGDEDYEEG